MAAWQKIKDIRAGRKKKRPAAEKSARDKIDMDPKLTEGYMGLMPDTMRRVAIMRERVATHAPTTYRRADAFLATEHGRMLAHLETGLRFDADAGRISDADGEVRLRDEIRRRYNRHVQGIQESDDAKSPERQRRRLDMARRRPEGSKVKLGRDGRHHLYIGGRQVD